jgi:lipopolysaccharide transport system permease protein
MGLTNSEGTSVLETATKTQTSTITKTEPPTSSQIIVPDEPLITIQPSQSLSILNLRELWAYRELFYFLVWRDVKVRYKQTLLGMMWAVLQPLFMMFIFTLFFGRLANMPSEGIPYPLFAYTALLPWTFLSNAVISSGNSLVTNANLITKVYFPRILIPAAAVGAGLLDFAIAFVILIVLMLYYGVMVSPKIAMLPVLVLMTTTLAFAVGLWLAALNVKYRDVRHALPFLMQIWMFLSPIIYPASLAQGKLRWLLLLNPLAGIIEGYRSALFAQKEFDWMMLGVSALLTMILLTYSVIAFRRMEKGFADTV